MLRNQIATLISYPDIQVEPGKRIPRGWQAFPIGPSDSGQNAIVEFSDQFPHCDTGGFFRVSIAIDEREEKLLQVVSLKSRQIIGQFDIRYAHVFQPFQIELSGDDLNLIQDEGCELQLVKGQRPLWLFFDHQNANSDCTVLFPHIHIPSIEGTPLVEMLNRLNSRFSLQFFGWQEGCVLDGLYDLAQVLPHMNFSETIQVHFEQFFDEDGNLVAEDDFSQPMDGKFYGVEAALPYGVLAQIHPNHPIFPRVVEYWRFLQTSDGTIQDTSGAYSEDQPAISPNINAESVLTAEGAYTIAYPMAVISKLPGWSDLADMAVIQLQVRQERLWAGDDFYLRARFDGSLTFRNWSRGFAWYLLGMVRTLIHLDPQVSHYDDLIAEFRRAAAWVMERQLDDGLWACFIDQVNVLPDTAGSAGLATALALGQKHAFLGQDGRTMAVKTLHALQNYLAPDGLLGGVAQVNKAGEALQKSNYRVISQMAMGLMGQLVAALAPIPADPSGNWLKELSKLDKAA
jgi:hypothetical protein